MNARDLAEMLTGVAADAITAANAVEDGLMDRVEDGKLGHPRSPSFNAGTSTSKPPKDDDANKPTIGQRHVRHAQSCWCLNDSAICCDSKCPCHDETTESTPTSSPLGE